MTTTYTVHIPKTATMTENLSLYHAHRQQQLRLAARFMAAREKQKRREVRRQSRLVLRLRIKQWIRDVFRFSVNR